MTIAAISGAAGAALAVLPLRFSLVLVVGSVGLLGLVLARSALSPVTGVEKVRETAADAEERRLRLPRRLYYLGAGTIGFLTLRGTLEFTISDWIFFLSFAVTCAILLTARQEVDYLVHRVVTIGVVLFALGGLVSSTQAVAHLQSASIVVRLLYLTLIWFWIGTIVLEKRKHVEYAVLAWVVSAALSAGGAVIQFFQGDVIPGGTVAWGRMTGFTPHFNDLGGLAATAFVPALMLAVDSRGRAQRSIAAASMALIGAGLLLSGSVGGLAAAFCATILWLVLRGVTRRTVVIIGVVAACGFLLMSATGSTDSPSPMERVLRVTSTDLPSDQGGSLYSRLDVYRDAWAHIQEQPFVGVGLDEASSVEVLGPLQVHNIVLSPWFSAGVLGLLGIALIVGGGLMVGAHLLRHTLSRERSLVAALFSGLVAFVVFAMGQPILYARYGWFPAAILLALHAQERRANVAARRAVAVTPLPGVYRGAVYETMPPGPRA
jgi:O-antigen ligase